jgi:hypothetical protein
MKNVKMFFKRNASTILTCAGGAGVVATAVVAVKDTPKAMQIIEKAEEAKGESLTVVEKIKYAGPVYIPAILIGASTLACIFGAHSLNKRQQASLMSAYALLDNSYKEYKKKVDEVYGEGADARIKGEIAKDKYNEESIHVEDEKQLFYDYFSERYFESTMEEVMQAEYDLNRKLHTRDYAYLNDYYDLIGLEQIPSGWNLGWSMGASFDHYWKTWIDFRHEKVEMEDGMECYIITMTEPIPDFEEYC